jgi:hypothetical protein
MCGTVYGVLLHRDKFFPYGWLRETFFNVPVIGGNEAKQRVRWRVRRNRDLDLEQQQRMEELAAIGYVSGTELASDDAVGVVIFDPEQTAPGLNLYCSSHDTEAILIDLEGRQLHRWYFEYARAFPDHDVTISDYRADFWRKVHVYPNGDLLAIFGALGIIKIDRNSNLLWAQPNAAHHDMTVQDSGEIFVLTRETGINPRVNGVMPILEDFITVLSADGEIIGRHSILDAVLDGEFSSLMHYAKDQGDLFHSNSVRILDGSHVDPAMLSSRCLN